MNDNESAPIYGLVLCGGRSSRMGTDKCDLRYHGQPQGAYLFQEVDALCTGSFLSVRKEQYNEWMVDFPRITDENRFRGPFNGLLSAHRTYPEAAWLVVACDLPLIDRQVLQQLLEGRNPQAVATAFTTQASGLPEPLVALWEPHGLARAEKYMETAQSSCPRKFLIQREATLVRVTNDQFLMNANSQEEKEEALKILS